MSVTNDQPRIDAALDHITQPLVEILIVKVILPIELLLHRYRGMPNLTGTDVQRLNPVVGTILLNDKQALHAHQNVDVGLYVAVIEHGARDTRLDDVGMRTRRHRRQFAGLRDPIISAGRHPLAIAMAVMRRHAPFLMRHAVIL